MASTTLQPGQRVVVIQQIPQRDEVWTARIEGEVVKCEQKKTGSWYAHSKDVKLWLDRLTLRKDDGEIVMCNLDQYTHVEVMPEPAPAPAVDKALAEAIAETESTAESESAAADTSAEAPADGAAGESNS